MTYNNILQKKIDFYDNNPSATGYLHAQVSVPVAGQAAEYQIPLIGFNNKH